MSTYNNIRKRRGLELGELKWDKNKPDLCMELIPTLRQRGAARARDWDFRHNPFKPRGGHWDKYDYPIPIEQSANEHGYGGISQCMSTAFISLWRGAFKSDISKGKGIFVDAGCGDSPDADIALHLGWDKAYGVDLFPQGITSSYGYGGFAQKYHDPRFSFLAGDISEQIPLAENSVDVVSCSAVLPLLSAGECLSFYAEVRRVLKPGGIFSVYGASVVPGRLVNMAEEFRLLLSLGFERASSYPGGAVFTRTIAGDHGNVNE